MREILILSALLFSNLTLAQNSAAETNITVIEPPAPPPPIPTPPDRYTPQPPGVAPTPGDPEAPNWPPQPAHEHLEFDAG